MKASDLPLLSSVSGLTIHPDGSWAVFSVSSPSLDADCYVGQLWAVPTDGSVVARRMTRGTYDSAPRFSPDGRRIAFLRSDADSPAQVYVVNSSGGEPVQVSDAKLGATGFRWSPDGKRLVFLARTPEIGRYGTVKELGASAEPPRRITTRKYQSNGLGYTIDRRVHIYLVDVPDPEAEPVYRRAPSAEDPTPEPRTSIPVARQLTSGDFDHSNIAFSPDGLRIAFSSARHPERDLNLAASIFELSISETAAEPVLITNGATGGLYGISALSYTARGALVFIANELGDGRDFVARNGALYRWAGEGNQPQRLTDPENIDLAAGVDGLTVLPDETVLALNSWRGSVNLVSISASGDLTTLVPGPIDVLRVDSANEVTVLSFSGPMTSGDIAILNHGRIDPITELNGNLIATGIAVPEELTVSARDGYPVNGWVILPKGQRPHPVLLMIHGGPYTQYTGSLFDEAQVYVDAGYAVVMCNPRGSSGYGQAHGRSIRQRMGTLDFTDVIDFLEGALDGHPELDHTRLGVMGGSYGGYLSAWIIAHDHRFAGAIVERGYLDPELFVGTSDIGDFFTDEYTGSDPEQIRKQSPQAFVHQVTTPTLVIHSESDLRCPLSQAERYYLALKRQGIETELLIFPGENHELSRSGRPRHRLERFEAILQWWTRFLPISDHK